MCADKLESAYEFKLQVEQADSVLREKYVGGIIKEELFFNEVEVHLDSERNDDLDEEMNISVQYEPTDAVLSEPDTDKNFLKNQLIILEEGKIVTKAEVIQQGESKVKLDYLDEFYQVGCA